MAYTPETVLGIVKARLNRLASDTSQDTYYAQRIAGADKELEKKGINLIAADVDDQVLLADFAAWKIQSRDKPGGLPDWLRLALRERWLNNRGRQVDAVTATPDFGTLAVGDTITLSSATTGASIYYTTDGSEPNDTSNVYSSPISVSVSFTLKAVAYAQGLMPSTVFSKAYAVA